MFIKLIDVNSPMDFRYAIVFLLLAQLSFADCVGFIESFDARVLDAKYRPIEGAEVTVKYDRGSTFGDVYFTTPIQLTNSSGKIHYNLANQGTLTRKIDCKIVITASAVGSTRTKEIIVGQHGDPVDVVLDDVYPVRFYVKDHYGAPLENATITIDGQTMRTNSAGYVKYYAKTGSYEYLASYLEGSQDGSFEVADDVAFEVFLTFYRISIETKNDQGTPIPVTISLFNKEFESEGKFVMDKAFGNEIEYIVDHKGVIKSGYIYPEDKPDIEVIFDVNAPLFEKITPETTASGKPRLLITISDQGPFASGVNPQTMSVVYKVEPAEPGAPWSRAATFTTGKNTFAAEFPGLPENRIVNYRAEVRDKEGNIATIEGKFATLPVPDENTTNNQTDTQDNKDKEQGIPQIYIVSGAIIIILVVFMLIRHKSKQNKGD